MRQYDLLPAALTSQYSTESIVKSNSDNLVAEHRRSVNQSQQIHDLYQDLYLTDLKNDLGEAKFSLRCEKSQNVLLEKELEKLKSDV